MNYLFFGGHGNVLLLFQQLSKLGTTVQQLLGGGIEVGTELGEGSHFSVLGQLQFESTGHLFHGLDLSGGTHTGHTQTHVDGGTDTLVE